MSGPRVGERRGLQLRRIGEHHVVVLPAQSAQVVDARRLREQLASLKSELPKIEARVSQMRGTIAELAALLERIEDLAIERIDDDPDIGDA